MPAREFKLDCDDDAIWIIALWKAIHGGDPSPEAVATKAIAALAPFLPGPDCFFRTSHGNDESGTDSLGVGPFDDEESRNQGDDTDTELNYPAAARAFNEPEPGLHRYYFRSKDQIFALNCLPLPTC